VVPPRSEALARGTLPRTRVVVRRDRVFPLWDQLVLPSVARAENCDLIHCPTQSLPLLWPRAATVVTIHDLMFFRPVQNAPNWRERVWHAYWRRLFRAVQHPAVTRLSISGATRAALLSEAGTNSLMVPQSAEWFVSAQEQVAPAEEGAPYFIHREGGGGHKNTGRIIEALASLRPRHPGLRLIVFGAGNAPGPAPEGVTFLGPLSDERLAAIYKGAVAVLAPSTEEGFGLATIEAFGFGTPVVTSDRSPMRDVAGGAALLVDPLDTAAIADAMERLARDSALREQLRSAGLARYRSFYPAAQFAADVSQAYAAALAGAPPHFDRTPGVTVKA
jgi:glycosyltransferase involved in cell wall biosynthesis